LGSFGLSGLFRLFGLDGLEGLLDFWRKPLSLRFNASEITLPFTLVMASFHPLALQ
jgi:hypothetical protein